MNELALFAGAGGGILAAELQGIETVCAVERDAYAAAVLAQRQTDGHIKPFPIWSDITTFDGIPWRGVVDIVSGGFPCQDISVAGGGKGINGSRSGMWSEMRRVIGEVQPTQVRIENSPAIIIRGLERIIQDLAAMGYVGRWGVLGAGAINGVCEGERFWCVATKADSAMLESMDVQKHIQPYSEESRRRQHTRAISAMLSQDDYSALKRNSNDVADGMDRLKAIGNGQNPVLAATAFRILSS